MQNSANRSGRKPKVRSRRNRRLRLSIVETISRTVQVYFKNFIPFTMLGFLFGFPVLLVSLGSPRVMTWSFPLIEESIYHFCNLVLVGPLAYGTLCTLRGKPISVLDCLSAGFSKVYLALGIITLLSFWLSVSLLLTIPGFLLWMRWFVAIPCAVIEKTNYRKSRLRSLFLTNGYRWTIFWTLVSFGLMKLLIVAPIYWLTGDTHVYALNAAGASVLIEKNMQTIYLHFVVGVLSASLSACVPTVVYYSLRNEKEGADLADLAAVFD